MTAKLLCPKCNTSIWKSITGKNGTWVAVCDECGTVVKTTGSFEVDIVKGDLSF